MTQYKELIDWKARGVDIVSWEICPIPEGVNEKDFAQICEAAGWEVLRSEVNIHGKDCLFRERPAQGQQLLDAMVEFDKWKIENDIEGGRNHGN